MRIKDGRVQEGLGWGQGRGRGTGGCGKGRKAWARWDWRDAAVGRAKT